MSKMIKRGALMPPEQIAMMSFDFAKDKVELRSRRGVDKRSFSFTIDAAKNPKHIDLTAESGTFAGQTIPGLYRLAGDTLVLCLPHDDNKKRPDAFESLGDGAPSRLLITLEREKK